MTFLWIFGALAIVVVAGALLFVLRKARHLKARHVRAFGTVLPEPPPDKPHLVDSPRALYHGTRFANGDTVLVAAWAEACVGDLFCTEDALFLRREGGERTLFIPLQDIDDAQLLRSFAQLAGKDLPMLRLRWWRGGELLQTDLSMQGGMANLEKLRREIHLRQKNVAEKLAPLLTREP